MDEVDYHLAILEIILK